MARDFGKLYKYRVVAVNFQLEIEVARQLFYERTTSTLNFL